MAGPIDRGERMTPLNDSAGKPRIAGTRITVADIVLMHRRLGRALEEISGTYDLPLAAAYAAMAYYYDHKEAVDEDIEASEREVERIRAEMPEPPVLQRLRDAGPIG